VLADTPSVASIVCARSEALHTLGVLREFGIEKVASESGFAGAVQSGGTSLDPHQQSLAAGLPVERQPRQGRMHLMLTTKRKPDSLGEILVEEFMQATALTQAALAEAMGVQSNHVNELCNHRRTERIEHAKPLGGGVIPSLEGGTCRA
jgi:hypothetical protein